MEVAYLHAERLEDVRVGVLGKRHARRAFDSQREQGVPGVRVKVLVAGRKVQRLLAGDDAQDGLVVEGVLVSPAGEYHQRVDVAQAARVMEELPDRDGPAVYRQLRHVLPYIVVRPEFPLRDGEGGRHGGELLGNRACVEDRVRRDGRVVLEVGDTVPARVGDPAVLVDANRAAGRIGPVPLREDLVHLRRPGRRLGPPRLSLKKGREDGDERGTGRAPGKPGARRHHADLIPAPRERSGSERLRELRLEVLRRNRVVRPLRVPHHGDDPPSAAVLHQLDRVDPSREGLLVGFRAP